MKVTRDDVLRYRVHTQQLDRPAQSGEDADVLDLGVQDTGADGGRWALAVRGYEPAPESVIIAWTLRGAPHVYRRRDVAEVASATSPFSEADAAKRVFDASKPLKAAGIPVLTALDEIAAHLRDIVRSPTVKGEMSRQLTARVDEPYLRFCRPCDATHLYEMPFRLAALRGGLELQAGTSPPVLQPIPGWHGRADVVPARLDPLRALLHLFGISTPKQAAGYLDAPVKDVTAHWPDDVVEVVVDGQALSALSADVDALAAPPDVADTLRLLGPFDPFLQCRDRELLVPDEARRAQLWRTLGRPGAVLHGHEIIGTWRPRSAGSKLRLVVDAWQRLPDLTEQAERLAASRGATFAGFAQP